MENVAKALEHAKRGIELYDRHAKQAELKKIKALLEEVLCSN